MQNYLSFGKQRKEKGGFLPYIYARKWEMPIRQAQGKLSRRGALRFRYAPLRTGVAISRMIEEIALRSLSQRLPIKL